MLYLLLIVGLALLIFGGDILVRGAVSIALKLKISTLVVGMTIVALGTSLPELLISLQAALKGSSEIALGNVLGSNIANLGLVLGITTLIFPIVVDRNSLRIDWPVMMFASLLLLVFIYNQQLTWIEGVIFLLILTIFNTSIIYFSRRMFKKDLQRAELEEVDETKKELPLWKAIGFIVFGTGGLLLGAEWFLDGAIGIAEQLGVSQHVIAVTLVAFGTSVPELSASVIAAFKKETDISVGSLIGSNIYNILLILGVTSTVKEISITDIVLDFDIWWVLGIGLLFMIFMIPNRKINRVKGLVFFLAYCVYIYLSF